jgi:AcrR family transcriptional regulator
VRTEQTTAALVAAARGLFAADGYAATSLDAVCTAAGVTKGALYHHFPAGKRALFAAVYAGEERALAEAETAAFLAEDDAWTGVRAGCAAFLRASVDPGVQRITLLDAPAALDAETQRVTEDASVGLLARGLRAATGRDERLLAELLHGALCRAALVVARSEDPDAALAQMLAEVDALLAAAAAR